MKKILPFIAAALLGTLFFQSCTKENQTGKVKFGLDLTEDASLKSATTGEGVVAALVTIIDENGMVVYDKEYLELIGSEHLASLKQGASDEEPCGCP